MSCLVTKPTKWHVRPANTQISLGIRPVWSESWLCTQWVAKDLSFLHADSEDSDQTGRMPRLIWVFAGRTVILLVLSWGGSNSIDSLCTAFKTVCQDGFRKLDSLQRRGYLVILCLHGSMMKSSPDHFLLNWAASWQNQQNDMCAQRRLRSDQPGHPPRLIRVFAVRMKKACVLSYP